jgi:hypothetical protein
MFRFFHGLQNITANVLRASEGRETKALNGKPTTNLKEISELSNFSKTSGFRLHAVSRSPLHTMLSQMLLKLMSNG